MAVFEIDVFFCGYMLIFCSFKLINSMLWLGGGRIVLELCA